MLPAASSSRAGLPAVMSDRYASLWILCVEKFPASLVDGDFSPFLEMTQGLADDHQKKIIEKRSREER